jgi:hypothetical protein
VGITDRSFRRYRDRYEAQGVEGFLDNCMSQESHRQAPIDEVMALERNYQKGMRDGMSGIFTNFIGGVENSV